MGRKGPIKNFSYSLNGQSIDDMPEEERVKLWMKINDRAMKALGYERVPDNERTNEK